MSGSKAMRLDGVRVGIEKSVLKGAVQAPL
jgi:hypothetical protein